MVQKQQPNYTFALTVVIIVCFLIGFVTTMNNSMIEFCKNAFNLNETQGQLVNSAFYGAYAMSIPFALMMNKIGYKATLVLGLAVVGLGFVLNFLCINSNLNGDVATIYWMFLGCMFIVALGIVMLQLVANPYVMVLGSPEKGAFRMTLSQALNSVATTLPLSRTRSLHLDPLRYSRFPQTPQHQRGGTGSREWSHRAQV